jgi:hypothetical protein
MREPRWILKPGIWEADDGLHVSIPGLLRCFGWPDDAEHREKAAVIVREVSEQEFPGVPVTEVD